MSGFVKIYGSKLLSSSIWCEPAEVRLVWITLLAMADRNGVVHCWIPGVAAAARLDLEDAEAALERLAAPDKYSRTPDHDGRRIELREDDDERRIVILNHGKYRAIQTEKQAKAAERQRRYREKTKASPVTPVTPRYAPKAEAEAEAEADPSPSGKVEGLTAYRPASLYAFWERALTRRATTPPGIASPRRLDEVERLFQKCSDDVDPFYSDPASTTWVGEVAGFAEWARDREEAGKMPLKRPWDCFRDDFGTWADRRATDAKRKAQRAKAAEPEAAPTGIPTAEETERKLREMERKFREDQRGGPPAALEELIGSLKGGA